MRIAHINNISGVPSTIAENQKKQGHSADVFVFNDTIYKQFGGIKVNYRSPIAQWKLFKKLKKDYDVWHYHYPYGSLKNSLESRNQGKIYLKHYHGDDIRGKHDNDFCLVSTPDLLQYAPNGKWLPNPIDTHLIEKIVVAKGESNVAQKNNNNNNNKVRIAHYPFYKNSPSSDSDYYTTALNKLQKENKCENVEILNLSHTQALHVMHSTDIIVGKILPDVGWFGRFELEGMALGKPVITYVSDYLYEKYKPPVYRTTKDTFMQDLESLIADNDEKNRLVIEGQKYIKEHHSIEPIIKTVNECYKS